MFCTFTDMVNISQNIIKKELSIRNSIFKENIYVDDSNKIDSLLLQENIFNKLFSISNSNIDFFTSENDSFEMLNLRRTNFNKLDLEKIHYIGKSNLFGIKGEVQNRETARIIKDSFEQQNNIIEANKFYALEMKEREKELRFSKEPFEWLVFKIHGLSSNHSQDWLLSLFWIVYFTFAIVLLDYNTNINTFIPVLSGFILGIVTVSHSDNMGKTILLFLLFIFNYGLYSEITKDFCLHEFTNKLNPFSIMNGWDDLNFGNFIYKIIIAYLIYQLIISIRQNTRRK